MDTRWSTRGCGSTWTSLDATRRQQEIAKRQAFFDAVQVEQGVVFPTEELAPGKPSQAESPHMVVEPLESPRHLTWLLLRRPASLDPHEQQVLTFLREVEAINTTYDLVQRFLTMVRQRHAEQLDTWLEDGLASTIPDLQTFAGGLKRVYSAMKAAFTYSYSIDLLKDTSISSNISSAVCMAVKSLNCYANDTYRLLNGSTEGAGDPRNWGKVSSSMIPPLDLP